MTSQEIATARSDIEATDDLLARALKLSGLPTALPDFKVLDELRTLRKEMAR